MCLESNHLLITNLRALIEKTESDKNVRLPIYIFSHKNNAIVFRLRISGF